MWLNLMLGTVVLLAHFLEGITGFGCTVMALPFCIALVGVKTAVPVLTMLGWILSLYIVVVDRKAVVIKEYIKIMSFMVLGLPVGIFLFASLPEAPLKILLGIFMVGVAASGLAKFYLPVKSRLDADTKAGKIIMNVILLLGGMIHGAFASGGPFLVVYATRKLTDKGNFRATLSAVWLTLNSIMMGVNLFHGSYPREVFVIMGTMVPFLIAGMVIGNIAHKRIDGTTFTKMVYSVLLVSGFFMFS